MKIYFEVVEGTTPTPTDTSRTYAHFESDGKIFTVFVDTNHLIKWLQQGQNVYHRWQLFKMFDRILSNAIEDKTACAGFLFLEYDKTMKKIFKTFPAFSKKTFEKEIKKGA